MARYTKEAKEEIRQGCKNCRYCHQDEWENGRHWCKYGNKTQYSQLHAGTRNCVSWVEPSEVREVKAGELK